MEEIWKSCPSYPNYAASNLGRIMRTTTKRGTRAGKILKLITTSHGYYAVSGGTNKQNFVHKLVTDAFIGICPKHFTVNHKNGIKTENTPDNLEYLSQSENMFHAHKTGLIDNNGENCPTSKLKNEDIIKIRNLKENGFKMSEIQKEFSNIHIRNLYKICSKETWKNI